MADLIGMVSLTPGTQMIAAHQIIRLCCEANNARKMDGVDKAERLMCLFWF
jgi:hypothetical protein